MAKQVIILDKLPGPQSFRYVLWAAVPSAQWIHYADATASTAFLGATAQGLQDTRDGKVAEKVETGSWPGMSLAQVRTQLQNRWTDFQNDINGTDTWNRYGQSWDGTTWT